MTGRIILALPADTHCGSAFGLMPDSWVTKSGNVVERNPVQVVIGNHWDDVWRRIGNERKEGDRLVVIHMGDATEGNHHGVVDIISAAEDEHVGMHVACMDRALSLCGFDRVVDSLYYVVGTPTHVRIGAFLEEVIAEKMGAVPYREGERYTWPKIEAGLGGKRMVFTHQGASVNSRAWLRGNLLHDGMKNLYWNRLDLGQEIPDWVWYAHRHRAHKRTYEGVRKNVTGVILPSMKGMDEYTNRLTVESMLEVGVGWAVIDEDGVHYRCDTIVVEQGEVIEL